MHGATVRVVVVVVVVVVVSWLLVPSCCCYCCCCFLVARPHLARPLGYPVAHAAVAVVAAAAVSVVAASILGCDESEPIYPIQSTSEAKNRPEKSSRKIEPKNRANARAFRCVHIAFHLVVNKLSEANFTENRRFTFAELSCFESCIDFFAPIHSHNCCCRRRCCCCCSSSCSCSCSCCCCCCCCSMDAWQVAMWREELLVRLDVDPHDFPIVVIGNKVCIFVMNTTNNSIIPGINSIFVCLIIFTSIIVYLIFFC